MAVMAFDDGVSVALAERAARQQLAGEWPYSLQRRNVARARAGRRQLVERPAQFPVGRKRQQRRHEAERCAAVKNAVNRPTDIVLVRR